MIKYMYKLVTMPTFYFILVSSVPFNVLSVSQGHLPFAVVGSTEELKIGNKVVKARQYPWGIVQGKQEFRLFFIQN